MTQKEIIIESLKNKLLSALKSDSLWTQFMEAIGEELCLERDKIEQTKYFFDYRNLLEDGLINLANTYGYIPNLIVESDLNYLKREVESIPYRIKNKTVYDGYYLLFKLISRKGEIYNFFWDGNKLIRAVDYVKTLEILNNNYNPTEPFTDIKADRNFSIVSTTDVYDLDTKDLYLDTLKGSFHWYLDHNGSILPSKHLGIDLFYDRMIGNNSITSPYFEYLDLGIDYTKRCPIIPHSGLQITGNTLESGAYNSFNESLDYSVPALKLKCATVFTYRKEITPIEPFVLDKDIPQTLDNAINWYLDTEDNIIRPSLSSFKYISCGNGERTLLNHANRNLFKYDQLIFYYSMDDEDYSTKITDYSSNQNHCQLVGDTRKLKGIVGKSVDFNGSTHLVSSSQTSFSNGNYTLSFWVRVTEESLDSCILDFNFLKIFYSKNNSQITVIMGEDIVGIVNIAKNTNNNIMLEFLNNVLNIYVNSIKESTENINTYSGTYSLYIGCTSSLDSHFIGVIDDIFYTTKIYTDNEKKYIYNNKVGIVTKLDNKLATYELSPQYETYENDTYRIIQSYVRGNEINDEFGFTSEDDEETTYIGTIQNYPIVDKSFTMVYETNDVLKPIVTLCSDENGNLYDKSTNMKVDGHINYSTGEYFLKGFSNGEVRHEIVSTSSPTKISTTLQHSLIIKNSITLTYTLIGGQSYIASANSDGVISGDGISQGTINYSTGELLIDFEQSIQGVVSIDYSYKIILNMKGNTPVFFNYTTVNSLGVSEIALEDGSHNVLAYMTFPPVQVNNQYNYISANFIIRKN